MNVRYVLGQPGEMLFRIALRQLLQAREADARGAEAVEVELTASEATALRLVAFEDVVTNDGLTGLLLEHPRDQILEMLSALDALGAARSADALRRLIGHFPDGELPADPAIVEEIVADLTEFAPDHLERLEATLAEEEDDRMARLRAFVAANAAEFRSTK